MLNLSYFLTRAAKQYPNSIATLHGDRESEYCALNARVSRLANGLRSIGVEPGDRVGIITDPEPRALEALFAPLRAGAVIVPMSTKLHAREYLYMLDRVQAKALICGRAHLDRILSCVRDLEHEIRVLGFDAGDIDAPGLLDYEQLLAQSDVSCPDAEVKDSDVAWIFFTSGTTGRPKGAMLTHRNLHAMVAGQLISVCPVNPGDRVAYLTPMSHAAGLWTFQHVARGATHVFPTFSGFRPFDFYRLVDKARVTNVFLAPTMIQMLLDEPAPADCDLSSLKNVIYGGAPMYVDRLKEALGRFGKVFTQGYALGEAPMSMTSLPACEHDLATPEGLHRLESVGKECHLVELRVVNPDGAALGPNEPGEIVVRGDVVMKGYWQDQDATAQTIRDGWLHTGDVGHFDENGYLYITDRIKDMIISGGANIYPREVEEALHSHSGVHEASVFGVPDPKWGERVIAAVVLREGIAMSEADLIEWCRQQLGSYKKPTSVCFMAELPKSDAGKILKRRVREMFLSQASLQAPSNRNL